MKFICILSPKSGSGAAFCAANIARTLAELGKKCLLADMCFEKSTIASLIGKSDEFVFNLSDVLSDRCGFDEGILKNAYVENLDFVSASFCEEGNRQVCCDMMHCIRENGQIYDYVIVNICSEHMPEDFEFDTIIYITTPQKTYVDVLNRYLQRNSIVSKEYVIVNKVIPEMIAEFGAVNIDDICDLCGLTPLGIIPWEPEIAVYENKGQLSTDNQKLVSTQAFSNIARRLEGEYVSALKFDTKSICYKKIKINYTGGKC